MYLFLSAILYTQHQSWSHIQTIQSIISSNLHLFFYVLRTSINTLFILFCLIYFYKYGWLCFMGIYIFQYQTVTIDCQMFYHIHCNIFVQNYLSSARKDLYGYLLLSKAVMKILNMLIRIYRIIMYEWEEPILGYRTFCSISALAFIYTFEL